MSLKEQNIPFLFNCKIKNQQIVRNYLRGESTRLILQIWPYMITGWEIKSNPTKCKHLLTFWNRLVRRRADHKATLNEQKKILNSKKSTLIFKAQEKAITVLSTQIQSLEQQALKKALKVFAECENLSQILKLVTSVKKIRHQNALDLKWKQIIKIQWQKTKIKRVQVIWFGINYWQEFLNRSKKKWRIEALWNRQHN